MGKAFVPVYSSDATVRALQDRVQRATTPPQQSPALRTENFDAAVGGTYRVRSTTATTLEVRLPLADAASFGKTVTLIHDKPVATIRVLCPTGEVNGGTSFSTGSSVASIFISNGDGGWFRV